ncbi:IPTL-CTERM sorting domain-containing protein [Gilvimarinus polysaccharolyticus]|uniref:IPTL-CTERM sorting domain-containing protein n=1 Tax=Gilvimarinus polysaccharolyticus TaxID=863921 RepID=UPI0018DD7D30|nr:IPTL-CTERM sorting domain-containing protein [Gilvimarinus polysaccharolyticus]
MMKSFRVLSALTALTLAATTQAAVIINPTNISTTEGGSTVQYQVVLDSAPDGGETVTVTPSSGDVTEGTVSAAINFTDANWETPQYITVTPGASGDGNDGDVAYAITNAVTSNLGGGAYDGETAPDVNANNANIGGIAVIIVDPSSIFVTEGGAAQTITVSVGPDTLPTDDISFDVTTVSGEATATPGTPFTVTLTAGNGYSVTFDITANDDALIDGDQAFTFTTSAATSTDLGFDGLNPADINGVALDDDVAPSVGAGATSLPTLSQWSQLLLLILLAGFGMRAVQRRKT